MTSKGLEDLAVVNIIKTANVSEGLPATVFRLKMEEEGSSETLVHPVRLYGITSHKTAVLNIFNYLRY
jgi:hypothetical protein